MTVSKSPPIDEAFEARLAYFYNVPSPERIVPHFLKALAIIESSIPNSESEAVAALNQAYCEVKKQKSMLFDTVAAAKIEYDIMLENEKEENFQEVVRLSKKLYALIWDKPESEFHRPVMLRSFLYQYKNSVPALSESEREMLIQLSDLSKSLLPE